jgi:hypothetical protein
MDADESAPNKRKISELAIDNNGVLHQSKKEKIG